MAKTEVHVVSEEVLLDLGRLSGALLAVINGYLDEPDSDGNVAITALGMCYSTLLRGFSQGDAMRNIDSFAATARVTVTHHRSGTTQ